MSARLWSILGLLFAASSIQVAEATALVLDKTFGAGQVQMGSPIISDLAPHRGQTLLLRPASPLTHMALPVPESAESKMIRFPDRSIAFVQGWNQPNTNDITIEVFGLNGHGEYSDSTALHFASPRLPAAVTSLITKAEIANAAYVVTTASNMSASHIDMQICRIKKDGGGLDPAFGCKTYAAPTSVKEYLPTSAILQKNGTLAISGIVCKDAFFPCSEYSPFLVTKAPESAGGAFDGGTIYSLQGSNAAVYAMKEDRQSRLLLVGAFETSASSSVTLVMRTKAGSGALDQPAFSATGYFLSDFRSTTNAGPEPALAVSPRSDGTVLVASLAPSASGEDCVISSLTSMTQSWAALQKTNTVSQPNICGSLAGPDEGPVVVLNTSTSMAGWSLFGSTATEGHPYSDESIKYSCNPISTDICTDTGNLTTNQMDYSAILNDDFGVLTLYKSAYHESDDFISEEYLIQSSTSDSIFYDGFGDGIHLH